MTVHKQKAGESFSDWLLVELNRAYVEARKGKRATADEQIFEMNEVENLLNLRDTIVNRTYTPSRGIAFVTRRPVIREIFAAPFRDRVVHHFLYNAVADWWDRRMIYDCYSCRVGKGTWFGVKRASKNMRRASNNYTKKAYIIKLDIQGYFMSLPRDKLFQRVVWGLKRQFPERGMLYDTLKFLWGEVIFDNPVKGVTRKGSPKDWRDLPRSKSLFCQPEGKGIVIGNLSSQLLSNIYLDQLDRFMMFELGYKEYGIYVDDFYFIVQEERYEQAKQDVRRIEEFLREIGLTLHPRKRYFQEINKGMAFLGVVIYPGRIVPGKRVVSNFKKGVRAFSAGEKDKETVVSYLGFMKNLNGRKKTEEVFREVGWDYK
ncbi:RNA-directed DNA polymerase [Candidatus Saccharibacteria bacterium]|nr:RNA-directed DNA polymerase [Candidatus Saccharibacteria bacterium]